MPDGDWTAAVTVTTGTDGDRLASTCRGEKRFGDLRHWRYITESSCDTGPGRAIKLRRTKPFEWLSGSIGTTRADSDGERRRRGAVG